MESRTRNNLLQLYPLVFKNFGAEFVQVELVPYGNAKIKVTVI